MYCIVLCCIVLDAMPLNFSTCHAEIFSDLQRVIRKAIGRPISTRCPTRGRIDLSMTDRPTDRSISWDRQTR